MSALQPGGEVVFQKGPGEGYGAAKREALAIEPGLRCYRATEFVRAPFYVVLRGGRIGVGKRVGDGGKLARDAWAAAVVALRKGR